ncbi:MerR family transcriptional regulator [Acetobacteraceae bacterium]|nr:MerR family transcriptional regulator [Acetobacteraceae bacterium]
MQREFSSNQSYVLLSDLANELKIPAYRLRSWEVLYPFIQSFRDSAGRRFYDKKTVGIFKEISRLLYQEGRKNTEIFSLISAMLDGEDDALKATSSQEENISFNMDGVSSSSFLRKLREIFEDLNKLGETIAYQKNI